MHEICRELKTPEKVGHGVLEQVISSEFAMVPQPVKDTHPA